MENGIQQRTDGEAKVDHAEQTARMLWAEYARGRWTDRAARLVWARLRHRIGFHWRLMGDEVIEYGGELAFTDVELLAVAIRALGRPCEYCGDAFGVDSCGWTRRDPVCRQAMNTALAGARALRLAAVAVCCVRCALAHRLFTDAEFGEVVRALRRCDEEVFRAALRALGEGTSWGLQPAHNARRAGAP
jgi:hypothetical protein